MSSSHPPSRRVYVGGSSDVEDVQESSGPNRVTARDLYNDRQDGSLLATARGASGSPTTKFDEATRLRYGDMDIDLRTAETLGLIKKNAAGDYVETQQDEQPQSQPQAQDDTGEELFPADMEAETAAFLEGIPPQIQDAIAASFITTGAERFNWNDAAHVSGMTVEELQWRAQHFILPFTVQADLAVKSLGADKDEFFEWARQYAPEELADAMRTQLYRRSTKGYKALASRYLRAVAPDVEALQAAGHKVKQHKGEYLVQIDGVYTNLAAAAKLNKI